MTHTPVMLDEAIEALQVNKGKRYIDATIGQLGHLTKFESLEERYWDLIMIKSKLRELRRSLKAPA